MALLSFIRKTLSLDYRSLALYRILIGLVVIADVLYRIPDVTNFYTDSGLIPRALFASEMSKSWSLSFHLANGSSGFIYLMFGLHLIFGVMLVLGYKSRWAMLGAYLMTVSVHNRNWLINNGGDDILRAILFISVFLPLDKYFSLEAQSKHDSASEKENACFSIWSLVFYVQVFAIYFVSYVLKDSPIWRSEYSALYFSSRLDIFANPIGEWLRQFPVGLKWITFFTINLEFLGPLALIFPFCFFRYWQQSKIILVALFWGLHLGIILTMWIGVFPYICLAMWSVFLPPSFWEVYLPGCFNFLTDKYQKTKAVLEKTWDLNLGQKAVKRSISLALMGQVFGGIILVALINWNLTTIKKLRYEAPTSQALIRWLHLYQEWNMFAPFPKMDNIWIEIPAVLEDGTHIELITGDKDIYSVKKDVFPKMIPNEHWRKFYLNVSENLQNARYFGGFLCRAWNEDKKRLIPNLLLKKFDINVYSQLNIADGTQGEIRKKQSWKHWCFDEDFKKESNPL